MAAGAAQACMLPLGRRCFDGYISCGVRHAQVLAAAALINSLHACRLLRPIATLKIAFAIPSTYTESDTVLKTRMRFPFYTAVDEHYNMIIYRGTIE